MRGLTDYSIVNQKLPCDVEGCREIFPGPILLKRHLQVKHKGLKRKAPETIESISLKQKLNSTSSLPRREFLNPVQKSPLSIYQKIENFQTSSSPSAEKAFIATFKTEPVEAGRSKRLSQGQVFKCDLCDYEAGSVVGLTRHRTGHTGGRKCRKCNRGYSEGSSSSENYLRQHEKTCLGTQKWISATDIKEEKNPEPLPLPQQSLIESPAQPAQAQVEPKTTVLKEEKEEVLSRNVKFEAFVSSQGLNIKEEVKPVPHFSYKQSSQVLNIKSEEVKPPVPVYSYNQSQYLDNSTTEAPNQYESVPTPKRVPQERTPFGTKGKKVPNIFN